MAQKLDSKETVSWEEISYSNMMEQEALLRILVKKGIVTKEEFMDELKALKKELSGKKGE
jgi:predicted RND superfamily exporter protein